MFQLHFVISTTRVISNENEKSFLCLSLLATKLQDLSPAFEMTCCVGSILQGLDSLALNWAEELLRCTCADLASVSRQRS
jgi:hypothetical protein